MRVNIQTDIERYGGMELFDQIVKPVVQWNL